MHVQNWTYNHAKHYIQETEDGATKRRQVRQQRQQQRKPRK